MIVGIDCNVLIFAGLVPTKRGTVDPLLRKRSRILLEHLKNDIVVLPVVAIAELMVPIAAHKRGALLTDLSKRFVCQPLDLRASVIAADIWANRHRGGRAPAYGRDVLKADAMIIASAKAAGSTKFYTHDKKCRNLASTVMEAYDLPTHSEDLFYDQG